jgi:hypothetical protein
MTYYYGCIPSYNNIHTQLCEQHTQLMHNAYTYTPSLTTSNSNRSTLAVVKELLRLQLAPDPVQPATTCQNRDPVVSANINVE